MSASDEFFDHSSSVAARGARAAGRADAAGRRADGLRRGRSGNDRARRGFRQGLERLGWSEGRNVRFDYRFARGGADQFQPLAKELVALQPDVILAQSTPVAAVLQRESRVIPIVFINVSDPIGSHQPADVRGGHRRQMVRAAQGDCARLGRTARADPFCEDLQIRSDRSRSIWRVPRLVQLSIYISVRSFILVRVSGFVC